MDKTAITPGAHRAHFIHEVVDKYLTKRVETDKETRQGEIFNRDRSGKDPKSRAAKATNSAPGPK